MPNESTPNVLAMLVCDQIIQEQGTNKKSLFGVFDNITAPVFPIQLRLAVYAKLSDVEGHYNFRLRFVSLRDERTVIPDISIPLDIPQLQPGRGGAELAINLVGIVITEPGAYEFQLWADDAYLHRITLTANSTGGTPWQQQQNSPQ
jgi:hypothetical protein